MSRAALRARAARARATGTYKTQDDRNHARNSQWSNGEFIAIDGEGFSDGPEFERIVGMHRTRYTGREHRYAFLAASDGREIYSDGRLSLFACLRFLTDIVADNPRAILVAFGASYDVCHMVCHDLTKDELAAMLGKGKRREKLYVDDGEFAYCLEYRPRKCFTVQRWKSGERRYEKQANGHWKATPHVTARLWDVWGFFQDSFVGVLKKWVPDDPDYEFVQRMKGERSIFERAEMPEIRRYNAAELRLLAKVMNKVRDAIGDLGLKITRWDGAGAIAAAMMTKHAVKEHKRDLPPDVFEAARCAYSGGHIEACKLGYHVGTVHHYDVNSAYPDQFRHLPSLHHGEWIRGTGEPPEGYTLVKCEWNFREGLPFYPLFYRSDDGTILYPARGSGWYWKSEYDVAVRYYVERGRNFTDSYFRTLEWHHFRTVGLVRPFDWVEGYYKARQDYIRAAKREGVESGPEKIIKLGLNSLYGKTAQQIGARVTAELELKLPPYFQLDWAGFVTAGCRARLMEAAIQKPECVIAFATDGLFTTEPLDLYTPSEKELGAWEYQQHSGITVVMPGVYWLHEADAKPKHYSRGFDKREMSDPEFVHAAWAKRQDDIPIKLTRLIGLGTALASNELWEIRGTFADSTRRLRLNGDNSKRYPLNLNKARPHRGLVDTIPRDHEHPDIFGIPLSAPYPIIWLDGDGNINRDLIEGELALEQDALDAALA